LGGKDAEKYYHAVWQRDRSQASAAFGLARLALAGGKRKKAIEELAAVPMVSRHAAAAAIAQVLILSHPVGEDRPSGTDLAEAADRLPGLHLDSGDPGGHARDRLTTVVREAVLWRALGKGGVLPEHEVFEARRVEVATRLLLEQSYQALARQAGDPDAHGVLLDRANAIRPSTFL
jgi:serine/threonine-protein kinase PknG